MQRLWKLGCSPLPQFPPSAAMLNIGRSHAKACATQIAGSLVHKRLPRELPPGVSKRERVEREAPAPACELHRTELSVVVFDGDCVDQRLSDFDSHEFRAVISVVEDRDHVV